FDAVTVSHTLEHLHEPVDALAEIRRVTKPGGRVAILVPNVRSLGSRVLREHWFHLDTPRHLTNFSPEGIRAALRASGLRLESLRTSARGGYATALYSVRRARGATVGLGDGEAGSPSERAAAAAVASAERVATGLRLEAGQEIWAVARR